MSELPATITDRGTACLLTPAGRGAVATVRLQGDLEELDAFHPDLFRAANGRPLHLQPVDRICFGQWGVFRQEDVVACRLADDLAEVHCHGGVAAARRILASLEKAGFRVVDAWQALTDRDPLESEWLSLASRTRTLKTATWVLRQTPARLRDAIADCRNQLHVADAAGPERALEWIEQTLQWVEFGRHLIEPWTVGLVGRPNVGKSSLSNALLGFERSIVFDQPGTTRDVLTGDATFDGWPVRLVDTAGIRETREEIERSGVARARALAAQVDCLVCVQDGCLPPNDDDRAILQLAQRPLIAINKCDLPQFRTADSPTEACVVSAKTGAGIDALIRAIVGRLNIQEPPADRWFPISARQATGLNEATFALRRGDVTAADRSLQGLAHPPASDDPTQTGDRHST